MPCADGELCLVPANSPKDPDGHGCQGGCGGRLHGICGSIADDVNENHRMCSACVNALMVSGIPPQMPQKRSRHI